jgi:hypothetical protein
MICASVKYYSGDKIKKNELGGACDRYGGKENCMQSFDGEILTKEIT